MDEISDRLTQSWNGFTNIDTLRNDDEDAQTPTFAQQYTEKPEENPPTSQHNPNTLPANFGNKKARLANYETLKPEHKRLLKMPKTFPGVKPAEITVAKSEENLSETKVETKPGPETKTSLDDLERYLKARPRERNAWHKKRTGDTLPRIKISKAKTDTSSGVTSGGQQKGSYAFNCARMMTELHEVCTFKSAGIEGVCASSSNSVSEENLLRPKTVQEARGYSAFTPRESRESFNHARCRSLPNLDAREMPKRFFVQLDPLRASAKQVNLGWWNPTSRRCQMLSENLSKLDTQGLVPSAKEKKLLIGEWIRETSQLELEAGHVSTEVETRDLKTVLKCT